MELTPDLQERIDNYLNGSLTGMDLQAFETQLAMDKALAAEVAFQRDLKEMLADTPENALRKNLEALNQQIETDTSKEQGNNWKWRVGLLPFLFVGAWWFSQATTSEVVPGTIFEEPNDTFPTLVPNDVDSGILGPVASIPPSELLAFEPNPILEALIEKNNENPAFQLTIDNWQTEYEIATLTDSLTLKLTSQVISDIPLLKADLQIHLFSSDPAQFKAFQPTASHPFDLQQVNPTTYQLTFQQNYLLPLGLYYLVIQDSTQTSPYFVEQFFVRLAE